MGLNGLILVALWGIMAGIYSSDPAKKNSESWEKIRYKDGVTSYYRWISKPDGISFRERKGEMIMPGTLSNAIHVITDPGFISKWMSGVGECKNLTEPANGEWYSYTVFSMPWPLNKRDLVSHNKLRTDTGKGITVIEVTCKDKYIHVKPGVTRLTDYKAQWKITKLDENRIHLVFIASSSAPPSFPRYIQDPVIEKVFHNNLVRLKETVEQN
jgi:hypothetical protein